MNIDKRNDLAAPSDGGVWVTRDAALNVWIHVAGQRFSPSELAARLRHDGEIVAPDDAPLYRDDGGLGWWWY